MSSSRSGPRFRSLWIGCSLLLFAGSLFGANSNSPVDSWLPFAGMRVVDPDGRRYVVIRPNPEGEKPIFEIASVPEGAPAITPAEGKDAKVRPGDRVIQRGESPITPLVVLVLPVGYGFVMIDQHGWVGHGSTVVFVDDRGRVGPVLELDDLFTDAERRLFSRTVSSVWWREGEWIDPDQKLLLVSSPAGGRAVDWEQGRVRDLKLDDFARALALEDPRAVAAAIELLQPAIDPAWTLLPAAAKHLTDRSSSLYVRLRAASLVARYDGVRRKKRVSAERKEQLAAALPVARELVRVTAFEPSESVSSSDRHRAVLSSARVLGLDAVPYLRALARDGASNWGVVESAFLDLGTTAVPALLEMVAEVDAPPDSRVLAANLIGKVGISDHHVALIDFIGDPNPYVASAVANSAILLGGSKIAEALVPLLERGTTQDQRIATYFTMHHCPKAIPALIACLERATRKTVRTVAVEALRFHTNQDFGEDPKAWRRELGL